MYKVLTLNNIRNAGLQRFPQEHYRISNDIADPDIVLVRSANMHDWPLPDSLKAVGRAGAGVNNIPLEEITRRGIPVFNTPGANANAVKELVIAGMLLASRNICPAWDYVRSLQENDDTSDSELNRLVEAGKKQFAGFELPGRTLGVIGLGAIGVRVANAAEALGMRVIGYDPYITIANAWQLSAQIEQIRSISELLAQADFVTLHVPMLDNTRHLINSERLINARQGSVLLNFARGGIVDESAVLTALDEGRLRSYVCDFPSRQLLSHNRVIALPHLGASTEEAEENCAVMVVEQIRHYLEHGTIKNSVNFPEIDMPANDGYRLLIVNSNIPHMIERISAAIAGADINILDMLNRSRGDIACTLLDTECSLPQRVIDEIGTIEGVLAMRVI
jgi:D-3-phosphoglycerate dehydrogenase